MVESTLAVGKKSIRFWTFNGKSLMNRNVLSVTIAGQSKEENSRRAELDTIKIYHLKKEYGAVKTLLMDLLITKCIWCVYNGYRVRHTLGPVLAEISTCTFQCVIHTRAFSLSVDSTHNYFSFPHLCPLSPSLPIAFKILLHIIYYGVMGI